MGTDISVIGIMQRRSSLNRLTNRGKRAPPESRKEHVFSRGFLSSVLPNFGFLSYSCQSLSPRVYQQIFTSLQQDITTFLLFLKDLKTKKNCEECLLVILAVHFSCILHYLFS